MVLPAHITNHPVDDKTLRTALKRHFGHDGFRPMQRQIVTDVLAGRDSFVLMPTGGGKSLCYQLPAVLQRGSTIVVSPLIALMQDQVKALEANGVATTVLNSAVNSGQIAQREATARAGGYDLIYMAPERLARSAGTRLLAQLDVNLFAVNEAHCISEWGHDFRPEYRQLGMLRTGVDGRFARVPIMALTATATPHVAQDVVDQLQLRAPVHYRSGFERKNLVYRVVRKHRMFDQILRYLQTHPTHEGIIYRLSRASTESLAERLKAHSIAALPYHAGLDSRTRYEHQHAFVYGQARVMVATVAFGMGIDKPNVRFVLHADLPRHLEAYYQETGRAGRDRPAAGPTSVRSPAATATRYLAGAKRATLRGIRGPGPAAHGLSEADHTRPIRSDQGRRPVEARPLRAEIPGSDPIANHGSLAV